MHAYALVYIQFSVSLSKHQTLADSGGWDDRTSSQLNQLAYLQWGHAAFAGLPCSASITVSLWPASSNCNICLDLAQSLKEWIGFVVNGVWSNGTNWEGLGWDKHSIQLFCSLVPMFCFFSRSGMMHACLTALGWVTPRCIRSSISKPDVDANKFHTNSTQSNLGKACLWLKIFSSHSSIMTLITSTRLLGDKPCLSLVWCVNR